MNQHKGAGRNEGHEEAVGPASVPWEKAHGEGSVCRRSDLNSGAIAPRDRDRRVVVEVDGCRKGHGCRLWVRLGVDGAAEGSVCR